MLLTEILYDSTNPNWHNDRSYNYMFLRAEENYINDIIRTRGYIS